MLRHKFCALGWHEKALWLSAFVSWAGVAVAAADAATVREFVVAALTSLGVTQGAIYATCVTRRLDRQYKAMLVAATTRQRPEVPAGRRDRLRLLAQTGPQGTSRSLSSGSA